MDFSEIFARMATGLKPLLPSIIVIVVATLGAMFAIYFLGRNKWIQSKGFSLPSLFFGLDALGIICVACAWIKLLLPAVYIVSFQKLVLVQYLMILVPGLVLAFCAGDIKKILSGLGYLVMEMLGMLSVSLICGYITEMRAGTGFALVYVSIGIFMVLYSVYLFIQDLEHISSVRKIDPEQIWRTAEDE